ncbi:MAG: LegC family aminotransferase [Verrucomicrobiota bacterium]|nr:LegC family aminotransferase [Verrucomicrobiota bacterium]
MIPLVVPNLNGREAEYLQQCIKTTFVSSIGPFVERFEGVVANATGVSQAVAVSSGTSGLHAALVAVGVGRDDLVVLPSFTFIASANAIAYCGASPWLFDVTEESWTLDPALLTKHFETETYQKNGRLIHKETGRRVAAVMPVYTFGMPADMDAIVKIANDYNLPVIADGAAALGATYKGRLSGNLGADLTIYSFNGNKTVTTGGGGAVVGEKVDLVKLVRHLTTTAKVGDGYHHDRIGFNYRMTNIAAAVGCAQMELLEKFVSAKRRIQENYNSALKSFPGVDIFPQPEWAEGACWLSGITMPDLESAKALRDRLKENNIDARPFWKSIHLQSMFLDSPRTAQTFSSEIWSRIVTLPCSSGLIEADQLKVISTIQKLLS